MGVRRRSSQRQQRRAATTSQDAALQGAASPQWMPRFNDVCSAIDSLYADELKPVGRILRKRVAERAPAAFGSAQHIEQETPADVDIKHLRASCEDSEALRVEPEAGGDWSVFIVGRAQTFVDIYSAADLYPSEMWGDAAMYFGSLFGDDMYLPGSRYSCAQALQARGLDFLQGRSLGQVCHIVQLAMSQKKLLGYLDGAVVPYAFSQSMRKEQCAQLNTPCIASLTASCPFEKEDGTVTGESALDMATWETARQYLHDILSTSAQLDLCMKGMVPLSNVKRIFRSKFHTELSETKLGYSKLSELLQDQRFSDICSVELHGRGYIVVQVEPQRKLLPEFCAQEPLPLDTNESGVSAESSQPCKVGEVRWPVTDGYVDSFIQRTFIHASPPPPTPPPNARRRSASLPKDVGSDRSLWKLQRQTLLPTGEHTEETESTVDSTIGSASDEQSNSCATWQSSRPWLDEPVKVLLLSECELSSSTNMGCMNLQESATADFGDSAEDGQQRHRLQFCPGEPLAFEELGIFLDSAPVTQTPYIHLSAPRWPCLSPSPFYPVEPLELEEAGFLSDTAPVAQTPYTPGSVHRWSWLLPSLGAGNPPGHAEDSEVGRQPQFCLDEPLAFEEADIFIDSAPSMQIPENSCTNLSVPKWACMSPSALVRDGCVGSIALSKVQNTFIHSPLLLPTPLRAGACRRSRSLPKNVGSDKNTWEATCQALGCSQIPRCMFNAGEGVPIAGIHVDCTVPPSPDFPTYCNTPHQLGSGPRPLLLASAIASQALVDDCICPPPSVRLPKVINLASLIQ